MKKCPMVDQVEDSINGVFFEELCSISQIFGYEIEPNVEKINPLNFTNCAAIRINLKNPEEIKKDESEENNKEKITGVILVLNFKTSNMYPHDLPEITIDTEDFGTKDLKNLKKVIYETAFQMCGRHMLLDIILAIEDYVFVNIFKIKNIENPIETTLNSSENIKLIDFGKHFEISSSSTDFDFCFSSGFNLTKNFEIYTDLARKENLRCETCASHHCGICSTYGIKSSDDFSAYFLRVFKFDMAIFDPTNFNINFDKNSETSKFDFSKLPKYKNDDKNYDYLNFTLFSMMQEINRIKDVVHESIVIRTKAFVSFFEDAAFFFIATPLATRDGLPLCSNIENLWLKVSEKTVYIVIKQLLEAINFLHRLKIVHTCIFPCNIKVLPSSKVILSDHGHIGKVWDFWQQSQNLCSKIKQQIEVHHFQKFSQYFNGDFESDVFQFGLIVLSLCECNIYNTFPVQIPQIFNQKLEDFTKRCVDYSKKRRFTTEKLLEHAYIKKYIPRDSLWMNAEKENIELNKSNTASSCADVDSRLLKEFELIRVIGKGGFGVVILAKNKVDNCVYAIKRISLTKRDWDERGKIMKEIQILSRLSHQNIVRYYNSWIEKQYIAWFAENTWEFSDDEESDDSDSSEDSQVKIVFTKDAPSSRIKEEFYYPDEEKIKNPYPGPIYIYMQMEFCEKKSLRDIIDHDSLYLHNDRLWSFFRDICNGLSYIHSQGMIHRDIKPQNILVSSLDQAKIVDFNLATRGLLQKPFSDPKIKTVKTKDATGEFKSVSRVGTFPYTAPEVDDGDSIDITTKSDMFSFGIVFFEMCHRPFKTKTKRYVFISRLRTELLIANIPDENKREIIKALLQADPKKRISASELLTSNLYPVPLDDINIDKVYQHLTNEPFSTHSKKILQIYFTHEYEADIRAQYLFRFHPIDIKDASLTSMALNCVKRYAYEFFKKRGCLDFISPTFIPYNQKKVFSFQPSLCFVNNHGLRLGLTTTYLPHLFDIVTKQTRFDLSSLPISRFGGIHDVYINDDSNSPNAHPEIDKEFYYAVVCTSKNIIPFLAEAITETYSIVSNFLLGNNIEDSFVNPNDFCVVKSIELQINHSQLILSIFCQIGIKIEDQTYILNILKHLYNCGDAKERTAKLESFLISRPRLKNHQPILMVLFNFEGTVSQLEYVFSDSFRIKFNYQVQNNLAKVNSLIESIQTTFNDNELAVKLVPYLFNNYIWPPDSFMYRYVGFQTSEPSGGKIMTLSSGGVFRHNLEHVKYHGYLSVDKSSHREEYMPDNNAFSDSDDIRMVYSSLSCKSLSKLHQFLHFCKICHFESHVVSHENILMGYKTIENSTLNFQKLHSEANFLRNEPFNLCVYVYNHSLPYDIIRSVHDRLVSLDICAFLCVDPEDFTIKIFNIIKDSYVETIVKNIQDAGFYLKNLLHKNAHSNDRQTPNNFSKVQKHRQIRFSFLDDTCAASVKKKYQTVCIQKTKTFKNLFNPDSEFLVIIVDLPNEDFSTLVSEMSVFSQKEETTPVSSKGNQAKINDLISKVKECMGSIQQNVVYFLFNAKNNKIKPLI